MMRATRTLLSRQEQASRYLLPPRSTWGLFGNAGEAALSLLVSQEDRDDFVETLNKGTIRADVLRQADFGNFLILSLYQDLKSKGFQEAKFQPQQFLKGAKLALQEFHNVKSLLENELTENHQDVRLTDAKNEEEDKKKESKDTDDDVGGETVLPSQIFDALIKGGRNNLNLDVMFKSSWKEEAKEDEDGLAGRLKRMVTEDFFQEVEAGAKASFLMEQSMNKKFLYKEQSGSIENVALLSARALVMEAGEDGASTDDAGEKITDEEKDTESPSSVDRSEGEDKDKEETVTTSETKKRPVAAQIEVLYDITKTFFVEPVFQIESGEESEMITKTFVYVGIFEGWLQKGKEDDEGVRWKLSQNRPALEFPTLLPSY